MSGKNKQADSMQMQAGQANLAGGQALSEVGKYGVDTSKYWMGQGQQLQQPMIDYYKAITGGDMNATISSLGPQLGNIASQTKQSIANTYNQPGGSSAAGDYARAMAQVGQGQQNAALVNSAFNQGITGLANVGSQDLQQGLQYLGAGLGGYGQATGANQSAGNIGAQLSQQAAQRKASTLGFIGNLAGTAGNVATGGMLGAAKAGIGMATGGFNPKTSTVGPGKTSAAGIQGQYDRGF